MSYFGATGTAVFGFLVTSPLGFKARVGSVLFTLPRRMFTNSTHVLKLASTSKKNGLIPITFTSSLCTTYCAIFTLESFREQNIKHFDS